MILLAFDQFILDASMTPGPSWLMITLSLTAITPLWRSNSFSYSMHFYLVTYQIVISFAFLHEGFLSTPTLTLESTSIY